MLIDFVHPGDAYLPELQAYEAFLRAAGHASRIHRSADAVPGDASIVWWMCGLVPHAAAQRLGNAFHVHEYASASVPPWAWAKDRLKHWRQPRPHYRLFQNEWVRRRMGFRDGVPFEYRDMGIAASFLEASGAAPPPPDHEFVYLGEMRRLQHFLPLFDALGRTGRRVLLIGELPAPMAASLQQRARVTLTGRVPHGQVPGLLRRARVGLNLVPHQAPFTWQTSTKLLEYCAAGLQVLSTDYHWVREFARCHRARFAYLPCRASPQQLEEAVDAALQAGAGPSVENLQALALPRLLAPLRLWQVLGGLA